MVVVRESPHAKQSPSKSTAQWPPKSPFQALLSSPSGRKKWQDRRTRDEERSPSPSPMRAQRPLSSSKALQDVSMSSDEEAGADEDEETLQLRLQEIQAKLRLKKAQQKAKSGVTEGREREDGSRSPSKLEPAHTSPRKHIQRPFPRLEPDREEVQVPTSPTREKRQPEEQLSPARRRLGLNRDLRADDVSLKRARDGTHVKRSDSKLSSRSGFTDNAVPKVSSFSERLAKSRDDAQTREAKQDRIEQSRSKGFGEAGRMPPPQVPPLARPNATQDSEFKRPSSARETQTSNKLEQNSSLSRSASSRMTTAEPPVQARANGRQAKSNAQPGGPNRKNAESVPVPSSETEQRDEDSPGFDPFSQTQLVKRNIPHTVVAREMAEREVYTIPRLFKEVKSPEYDPPDCEADYVVFAILASKSSPFDQKSNHRTNDEHQPREDAGAPRNKFMVLHLTDLKWELDCFLFGTAFDQFWKLNPGTLLAILNPAIMPPKGNQNNGRFSLKLGSSEDQVMEIGAARDLGYCVSVKKDGQQCAAWIDKRHTEICEFHLNLLIDKSRKNRMEVNTMFRKEGPAGDRIKSQARAAAGFDTSLKKDSGSYHREFGRVYAVPSGFGGASAASMLDSEDRKSLSDEASRKRIAAAQKERDLAKRLGEIGNGPGAEYLRTRTHSNPRPDPSSTIASSAAANVFDKPSAASLGLLANKATDARLSPPKDRKRHFGLGALSRSNGGRDAIGWGGAKKAGLLNPSAPRLGSPEKGQTRLQTAAAPPPQQPRGIVRPASQDGSASPKKRARFALEKGIREPGRESLGEDLRAPGGVGVGVEEEEDDGLDIV